MILAPHDPTAQRRSTAKGRALEKGKGETDMPKDTPPTFDGIETTPLDHADLSDYLITTGYKDQAHIGKEASLAIQRAYLKGWAAGHDAGYDAGATVATNNAELQ